MSTTTAVNLACEIARLLSMAPAWSVVIPLVAAALLTIGGDAGSGSPPVRTS
jgi:hypothetical protein